MPRKYTTSPQCAFRSHSQGLKAPDAHLADVHAMEHWPSSFVPTSATTEKRRRLIRKSQSKRQIARLGMAEIAGPNPAEPIH